MSHIKNLSLRYYEQSITLVMVTSILVRTFGGYTASPSLIKIIFSLSIWFALLLFPWLWIKCNDFSKIGKYILNSLLIWGLIEIIRSFFFPSPETNGMGNKYITLFFNEYCSLIFIPPLYAYTVSKYNILPFLFRSSKKYVWGGLLTGFASLHFFSISVLSVYMINFWNYVSTKNRIYIYGWCI